MWLISNTVSHFTGYGPGLA